MSGLNQVGPTFVGLDNYRELFKSGDVWIYFKNTMILWIMCFIPQIFFSLLLGAWFSDVRLRLKGSRFFKTVIYLPNLIMASAFSMLFFTLFSDAGPINSLLMQIGFISEPYKFLSHAGSARGLISQNICLMWFGNTTILLMAGMMGIDSSLYEAAECIRSASANITNFSGLPLKLNSPSDVNTSKYSNCSLVITLVLVLLVVTPVYLIEYMFPSACTLMTVTGSVGIRFLMIWLTSIIIISR
jgi:multiple sugar transport system permease protein